MTDELRTTIDSPLGRQEVDHHGPPVGVVRMDFHQAYADTNELLKKWINESDSDAFAEIVARHSRMVFATSRRILGNPSEAEDVTQDSFIKAFRQIRNFHIELLE